MNYETTFKFNVTAEDLDIIKMIVMKQKSFIFYLGSAEEKEEGSK